MRPSRAAGLAAILAMLTGTAQAATAQERSTATRGGDRTATAAAHADRSIVRYLTGPVSEGKSPGLFAAILDEGGIRSISVAGVRKQGSNEEMTVDDLVPSGRTPRP